MKRQYASKAGDRGLVVVALVEALLDADPPGGGGRPLPLQMRRVLLGKPSQRPTATWT